MDDEFGFYYEREKKKKKREKMNLIGWDNEGSYDTDYLCKSIQIIKNILNSLRI